MCYYCLYSTPQNSVRVHNNSYVKALSSKIKKENSKNPLWAGTWRLWGGRNPILQKRPKSKSGGVMFHNTDQVKIVLFELFDNNANKTRLQTLIVLRLQMY